jgi:hypothetical protein
MKINFNIIITCPAFIVNGLENVGRALTFPCFASCLASLPSGISGRQRGIKFYLEEGKDPGDVGTPNDYE